MWELFVMQMQRNSVQNHKNMVQKNGTDKRTGSPERPFRTILEINRKLAKPIVLLSDNMGSVCDANAETFWAKLPLQGCASLI